MGRYGGIYLSDDYNEPKLYLSPDEEIFLIDLLKNADDREQLIINSILNTFSMPKMGYSGAKLIVYFFLGYLAVFVPLIFELSVFLS